MKALLALVGAVLALCGGCTAEPGERNSGKAGETAWRAARQSMVSGILALGVQDEAVLQALSEVPRHLFVPGRLAAQAYELKPLPIGDGQTISDPYLVGLMTELLALTGSEKVLEIGTGSGYQAAVLSRLVPRVYSIEIRPQLADSAARRLAGLAIGNVEVRCGDGYQGWPEEAPFDAIIVTAAPPAIPEALVGQLGAGGRLVVPVGSQAGNQILTRLTRQADGRVEREQVVPVRFVPMIRRE